VSPATKVPPWRRMCFKCDERVSRASKVSSERQKCFRGEDSVVVFPGYLKCLQSEESVSRMAIYVQRATSVFRARELRVEYIHSFKSVSVELKVSL
jgi:hypothetical protein